MLQGRALAAISNCAEQACHVFEQICLTSSVDSDIYIEAIARLGIRKVGSGIYQKGIPNLKKSLQFLENHPRQNLLLIDLKTDILETLAYYEMNCSRFDRAIELYEEVIDLRHQHNIIHKTISPLVHQGIILRRKKDYERAIELLKKAKKITQVIPNQNNPVFIDHHLGYVYLNQGNIDLAEKCCESSLQGYKNIENDRGISDCYEQLGFICLAKNKFDDSEKYFEKALNTRISIGNIHGAASSVLDLALISWHKKRYLIAIKFLLQGFKYYYELGILNRIRFTRMLNLAYVWTLGKRNWTM
jgi:tetratricopeptide (TPR) repeat protein